MSSYNVEIVQATWTWGPVGVLAESNRFIQLQYEKSGLDVDPEPCLPKFNRVIVRRSSGEIVAACNVHDPDKDIIGHYGLACSTRPDALAEVTRLSVSDILAYPHLVRGVYAAGVLMDRGFMVSAARSQILARLYAKFGSSILGPMTPGGNGDHGMYQIGHEYTVVFSNLGQIIRDTDAKHRNMSFNPEHWDHHL